MSPIARFVSLAVVVGVSAPAAAQVVYVPPQAGDFSLFADGDLAGQNGWVPVTTTPTGVQISGGRVVVQSVQGTTDLPDARYPFTAAVPATAGTSYYVGLTLRVTSVPTVSNIDDVVGTHNTAAADDGVRLAVYTAFQAPPGQYELAFCAGPAPGPSFTYFPSPVSHTVGEALRVILAYDFVAGTAHDRASLYVDPASPDRTADTAEVNLRNTGPSNPYWTDLGNLTGLTIVSPGFSLGGPPTPGFEIGRIIAADNFAAAYSFITPVPEPSAVALLGAIAACVGARRWRAKTGAKSKA